MDMDYSALEKRIGYKFNQKNLLETALTHPSYTGEHSVPHYQRLEFLGDAVLQLLVSEYLFEEFPDIPEGQLTARRAALVREETLCEAARAYDLGSYLRLSWGEEKSGGRDKCSILADVMEALIAAVYLDGGMKYAYMLVMRTLFAHKLEALEISDAKTRLQEWAQSQKAETPEYFLVSESGPDHDKEFVMGVSLKGECLAKGRGKSKKQAQQRAAHNALNKLEKK